MPDSLTPYEKTQRIQTLAAMLWIAFGTCLVIGILNVQFRAWESVSALFGLALLCIVLLWINARGHYTAAASILSLLTLMVINTNIFEGDGIRDSGIIAYPLFIMAGVLFFGKRAAPYFYVATLASLVGTVYLEIHGRIHPTIGPTRYDIVLPMVILLLAATAITWVIIGNMERNLDRAKESEAELRANYDLTLEAWAKVLEIRDRETEGHSRRLVELSTQLAKVLGLGEEQILNLRRGALLHDIGKLAIPDDILLKPGALNDAERKMLEQHPAFAKQMLSQIAFLEPCLDVAYSHHERWDGSGYPQGLKGEAIPLSARIFAVVDQWDALTSDRPYRKAWTREGVIAYLHNNAGKIYDPQIVNVFLAMI